MIYLRFAIRLHNPALALVNEHHGPLFHRWLPNGEDDALTLASTDPNIDVRVWFERRGYVDLNNLIQFDYQRKEVDESLVAQQAILDAGPLRGSLIIRNIDQKTIAVLEKNKEGEEEYITLGKRVIALLEPLLSSLVDALRVRFGQFWIMPFEKWDSRKRTLGAYCLSVLDAKYSLENEEQWSEFVPNEPMNYGTVALSLLGKKTFSQYITKSEWVELKDLVDSGYKSSIAASTLILAHELFDSGNYRQAYTEGVTALELAVSEFFRDRLFHNETLIKEAQSFRTLPLPAQFVITAGLTQNITSEEIAVTLKAIKTRNSIVHEAQQVGEEKKSELRSLLAAIAKLIPGPGHKLPSAHTGINTAMPEEEWLRLR